jgi:hypothetical protein
MRRILVDDARKRNSAKRGGSMIQVPLDEASATVAEQAANVAALDDACSDWKKLISGKVRLLSCVSSEAEHRRDCKVLSVSPGP